MIRKTSALEINFVNFYGEVLNKKVYRNEIWGVRHIVHLSYSSHQPINICYKRRFREKSKIYDMVTPVSQFAAINSQLSSQIFPKINNINSLALSIQLKSTLIFEAPRIVKTTWCIQYLSAACVERHIHFEGGGGLCTRVISKSMCHSPLLVALLAMYLPPTYLE